MTKETLSYAAYIERAKRPSQIDVGGVAIIQPPPNEMWCPRCHHFMDKMEHGDKRWCPCGLIMQLHGTVLTCVLEGSSD